MANEKGTSSTRSMTRPLLLLLGFLGNTSLTNSLALSSKPVFRQISSSHLFGSSTDDMVDDVDSSHYDALIVNNGEMSRRTALARPTKALAGSALLFSGMQYASAVNENPDGSTQNNVAQIPGFKKPFPLASFGLQIYDDETAYRLTLIALEVGYRNFFASVLANNQKGFAKAIKASGIPREELYICGTVLSNRAKGESKAYAKTLKGCEENMNAMSYGSIDYLDMIMLDYPGPDEESILGQWRAFQDFQKDGLVTDLAVSNFSFRQIDSILMSESLTSPPIVNQLPYSVTNHPKGTISGHAKRNMLVQSWSPLSTTLPKYKSVLANIGKKYNKSAAQVGLRWIVQNGASFSTQSKNKAHFEEDLKVFDFRLSDEEMKQISLLEPPALQL